MYSIQNVLENAIEKCLAEKIPIQEVQELKEHMKPRDISFILPYLENIRHPEEFFGVWKKTGRNSIDGLYIVFDFFSVLLHLGGLEAETLIREHANSESPYIERVLKFAADDRVLPDLLSKFIYATPTEFAEVSASPKSARGSAKPAAPLNTNKVLALREAENTWELAGETMLLAKHTRDDKGNTVIITVNNVYGPIADLRVYVRTQTKKSRPKKPAFTPARSWQAPEKVEEIIDLDGELWYLHDQKGHNFYEETPWFCTWRHKYPLKGSLHYLEIMLVDPREFDANGKPLELYNSAIIPDWEVYG